MPFKLQLRQRGVVFESTESSMCKNEIPKGTSTLCRIVLIGNTVRHIWMFRNARHSACIGRSKHCWLPSKEAVRFSVVWKYQTVFCSYYQFISDKFPNTAYYVLNFQMPLIMRMLFIFQLMPIGTMQHNVDLS